MGYNIDGQSHILLVACRDIACGEKLYCDYNGKETFSTFPLANYKSWWPAVISHSSFPLANHKSYDPSNNNEVGQNRAQCYNDLVFGSYFAFNFQGSSQRG